MNKLVIHRLCVPTIIGVLEHERHITQDILIDLEISADIDKAAVSDDIAHALDYRLLCDALRDCVAKSQHQLIETLAQEAADLMQEKFQPVWLKLTLTKRPQDIIDIDGVSVVIER